MGLFTIISSPFPLGVAGDVAEVHGGKAFADAPPSVLLLKPALCPATGPRPLSCCWAPPSVLLLGPALCPATEPRPLSCY
ncbi:unnamed protein product [Arctogadus glacialis]